MKILVTNDDGIYSQGLIALVEGLKSLGDVVVVAPDTERSAVGHSITITHPLRVQEIWREGGFFGFAVNGTPADCIKIALSAIMDSRADLVVAGINQGLNTGTNIMYSGTVSGAMEGAILGIPAFAVSAEMCKEPEHNRAHFALAAEFSMKLAKVVMEKGLPKRTLLNINFPAYPERELQGVAITRQGQTLFRDRFQKRLDPRQKVYYWLEGEDIELEGGDGSDYSAVKKGYISITPLYSDLTHHSYMETLKNWKLSLDSRV